MKTTRLLMAGLALVAMAGLAWAGGCCKGFPCKNKCPLAQQANQCRADGSECLSSKQALAKQVIANLGKI